MKVTAPVPLESGFFRYPVVAGAFCASLAGVGAVVWLLFALPDPIVVGCCCEIAVVDSAQPEGGAGGTTVSGKNPGERVDVHGGAREGGKSGLPNFAFEPSVVRGQGAPRARRKYAPAALDPTPCAAAQRGR